MNDETRGASSERSAPGVIGPSSLLGAAFAVGVVGAVLVLLLTTLVEQSGPEGEFNGVTWSFRGNGALSVLFAGIPAVLGAGWVGLGLWTIETRRWLAIALMTGGLLLILGFVAELAPILLVANVSSLEVEEAYVSAVARVSVAVLVVAGLIGSALAALVGRLPRLVLVVIGVVALGLLGVVLSVPTQLRLLTPLLTPLAASAPVLAVAVQAGARGGLVGACLLVLVGNLLGIAAFVWVAGVIDHPTRPDEVTLQVTRSDPACAAPDAGCPSVLLRGFVSVPVPAPCFFACRALSSRAVMGQNNAALKSSSPQDERSGDGSPQRPHPRSGEPGHDFLPQPLDVTEQVLGGEQHVHVPGAGVREASESTGASPSS